MFLRYFHFRFPLDFEVLNIVNQPSSYYFERPVCARLLTVRDFAFAFVHHSLSLYSFQRHPTEGQTNLTQLLQEWTVNAPDRTSQTCSVRSAARRNHSSSSSRIPDAFYVSSRRVVARMSAFNRFATPIAPFVSCHVPNTSNTPESLRS